MEICFARKYHFNFHSQVWGLMMSLVQMEKRDGTKMNEWVQLEFFIFFFYFRNEMLKWINGGLRMGAELLLDAKMGRRYSRVNGRIFWSGTVTNCMRGDLVNDEGREGRRHYYPGRAESIAARAGSNLASEWNSFLSSILFGIISKYVRPPPRPEVNRRNHFFWIEQKSLGKTWINGENATRTSYKESILPNIPLFPITSTNCLLSCKISFQRHRC